MKYFYFSITILLFSCVSKDTKMCDCLEAGEKLNDFSAKILMKEVSQKEAQEMKKLKAEKAKKCADYQKMSGEEMLKRKAECAN
ncbi:MAG: hypothetical protein V4622_10070 [Bacteroidota bacterium]